ncbi:MAG: amidohydrolase [Bacteroidetes bacterium]|nr:amidohydrolase [Bacteroidota bacterium]MBS1973345.1 amidohydrolase [Bacteroidota bacterium]
MTTLTITLIQSHLHWGDKSSNLDMFEEKIAGIKEKTEIVVLPEMFSTGFQMDPGSFAEKMDGPTIEWMRKIAAEKRVALTGSVIIEEEGKYYNRLIWMLPNGQMGHYDKRHRFAYAGESEKYTAGNKRLVASIKGWKINLLVCYDLRFPVWCRQSPKNERPNELEFDLLIFVANWPERRNHAWKSLLVARAIENQSFVIGLNRVGEDGNKLYHSGDSMIIGPLGEVLYHQAHKEDIFTYSIHKETLTEAREKFPFWKDADRFLIQP